LTCPRQGVTQIVGQTDDLFIGLKFNHSGRFCRPTDKKRMEPHILYTHPVLNRKFGLPEDFPLKTDSEIEQLIANYIGAAVLAQKAGFQFVDVKHCHGYLGHEFLSAVDRPGRYGGSFENRTRFLREIAFIKLIIITAGSPYYNPHIQRPALFPPSHGYAPPKDPLAGVARQINVTAELKARHPNLLMVGSGYSYLQEWLPKWRRTSFAPAKRILSGWGAWCCPTPTWPPTCWQAGRSSANASAAPSAIAPPPRATGW
jgi:hypothetical protein